MTKLVAGIAGLAMIGGLVMIGGSMALAQESTRNLPPRTLRPAQQSQEPQPVRAAPVGHRQPRAGDVPSESGDNDPARIDAQDRELDRMIKGICKGC